MVYLPLLPVPFVELLRQRNWEFVEVPDDEFLSMACNVLALGPGRCLMLDQNPNHSLTTRGGRLQGKDL